jgi:glycine cleavage system aminomethyltransferase T
LCREDGGVLDDVFVYRLPDRFYIVVNAANAEKDVSRLRSVAAGDHGMPPGTPDGADGAPPRAAGGATARAFDVDIRDLSADTSMFALQGPEALAVYEHAAGHTVSDLGRFAVRGDRFAEADLLVSRTGYTGEDGVEIYVDNEAAPRVWQTLTEAGSASSGGLAPVGLAARDSLRFEPGFALYGHELDEETSPVEARLKWACFLDRPFVGRDAVLEQVDAGVSKKLATVRMIDRGRPREG